MIDDISKNEPLEIIRGELKHWNLEEILPIFEKEKVTQPVMWEFSKEDLKGMGVGIVQCKKYMYAVEQLTKIREEKVIIYKRQIRSIYIDTTRLLMHNINYNISDVYILGRSDRVGETIR